MLYEQRVCNQLDSLRSYVILPDWLAFCCLSVNLSIPHVTYWLMLQFWKFPLPVCVCVCVCVCVLSMLQNALKVLLCSLESCVSCSFFFVLLMLAQETFSILPQDHLGKLLSSGLKVSPHSFSSPVRSLDCCGEASGQTHSTSGIKSYSLLDCMSTLFAYYTLSPLDSY